MRMRKDRPVLREDDEKRRRQKRRRLVLITKNLLGLGDVLCDWPTNDVGGFDGPQKITIVVWLEEEELRGRDWRKIRLWMMGWGRILSCRWHGRLSGERQKLQTLVRFRKNREQKKDDVSGKKAGSYGTVDPWRVGQEGGWKTGQYIVRVKWSSKVGVGLVSQRREKDISQQWVNLWRRNR